MDSWGYRWASSDDTRKVRVRGWLAWLKTRLKTRRRLASFSMACAPFRRNRLCVTSNAVLKASLACSRSAIRSMWFATRRFQNVAISMTTRSSLGRAGRPRHSVGISATSEAVVSTCEQDRGRSQPCGYLLDSHGSCTELRYAAETRLQGQICAHFRNPTPVDRKWRIHQNNILSEVVPDQVLRGISVKTSPKNCFKILSSHVSRATSYPDWSKTAKNSSRP